MRRRVKLYNSKMVHLALPLRGRIKKARVPQVPSPKWVRLAGPLEVGLFIIQVRRKWVLVRPPQALRAFAFELFDQTNKRPRYRSKLDRKKILKEQKQAEKARRKTEPYVWQPKVEKKPQSKLTAFPPHLRQALMAGAL